jgi:myosin heavy subunit
MANNKRVAKKPKQSVADLKAELEKLESLKRQLVSRIKKSESAKQAWAKKNALKVQQKAMEAQKLKQQKAMEAQKLKQQQALEAQKLKQQRVEATLKKLETDIESMAQGNKQSVKQFKTMIHQNAAIQSELKIDEYERNIASQNAKLNSMLNEYKSLKALPKSSSDEDSKSRERLFKLVGKQPEQKHWAETDLDAYDRQLKDSRERIDVNNKQFEDVNTKFDRYRFDVEALKHMDNRREDRTNSMKVIGHRKAVAGIFKQSYIEPSANNYTSVERFFKDITPLMKAHYENVIRRGLKTFKTYWVLVLRMKNPANIDETELVYRPVWLKSDAEEILKPLDIDQAIIHLKADLINNKLEDWKEEGSGWVLDEISRMYIDVQEYRAVKGGTYIPF